VKIITWLIASLLRKERRRLLERMEFALCSHNLYRCHTCASLEQAEAPREYLSVREIGEDAVSRD
jgi:hypothetical protein